MDQSFPGRAAVLVFLFDIDEIPFVIEPLGFVIARHGLRHGGRNARLYARQYLRPLEVTSVRYRLDVPTQP